MADDSGEKTKKPTAKKIRESKKKGDVAKVPTIPKFLSMVAVIELMLMFRDTWWRTLEGWMDYALSKVPLATGNQGNHALGALIGAPLLSAALMMCIAALLVAAMLAAIGNILQTGLIFSPEAIPKKDYIDPVSNAKQMLSPEQLIQLLLNLLKVGLIGLSVFMSIAYSLDDLMHIADGSLEFMFNTVVTMIGRTERFALLFILLSSVLDWVNRKHFHYKQQMMSHEEYDREMKEEFGNKHVRQQRKKISNEIMLGDAARKKTKAADVVVVNPSHFAVALLYVPSQHPLPIVVARGSDETAEIIKAVAKQERIPIVKSVWLARTLYAVGIEHKPIPRLTLRPVAAVYRAILTLGKNGAPIGDVIEMELNEGGEAPNL
jgi:type III secretion protein U